MAEERDKRTRLLDEQAVESLLLALVRAHADPLRPIIAKNGIEERDLAFEADLLAPPDMELTIYATQKRNRIVFLLRKMQERGWARMEVTPPRGAYHLFLQPKGLEHAQMISRSWWQRMKGRWKGRSRE